MKSSFSERPLRISLIGAAGRMGKRLVELIVESPIFCLSGAIVKPGDDLIGQPIGTTVFTDDLSTACLSSDVVIDFSVPEITPTVLQVAEAAGRPIVCGVTGLSSETRAFMDQVAQRIPVFYASNMSCGIAAVRRAIAQMAIALKEADVEILELHHSQKKDAPSGTALSLGQAVAQARGWSEDVFCLDRSALHIPRQHQEIGFASLRGGNHCGTHTVFFLGADETVSITHEATSRRVFALGALKAAKWIINQSPGRYTTDDMLA